MGYKNQAQQTVDFHHHHHHLLHMPSFNGSGKEPRGVPKGCLAIMVGQQEDEQQRFVIPVMYMNHPLFAELLKEAEEEYGFEQKGPIAIPCGVEEFRYVQGVIDKEQAELQGHHHDGGHHHHHHPVWCFRV